MKINENKKKTSRNGNTPLLFQRKSRAAWQPLPQAALDFRWNKSGIFPFPEVFLVLLRRRSQVLQEHYDVPADFRLSDVS